MWTPNKIAKKEEQDDPRPSYTPWIYTQQQIRTKIQQNNDIHRPLSQTMAENSSKCSLFMGTSKQIQDLDVSGLPLNNGSDEESDKQLSVQVRKRQLRKERLIKQEQNMKLLEQQYFAEKKSWAKGARSLYEKEQHLVAKEYQQYLKDIQNAQNAAQNEDAAPVDLKEKRDMEIEDPFQREPGKVIKRWKSEHELILIILNVLGHLNKKSIKSNLPYSQKQALKYLDDNESRMLNNLLYLVEQCTVNISNVSLQKNERLRRLLMQFIELIDQAKPPTHVSQINMNNFCAETRPIVSTFKWRKIPWNKIT